MMFSKKGKIAILSMSAILVAAFAAGSRADPPGNIQDQPAFPCVQQEKQDIQAMAQESRQQERARKWERSPIAQKRELRKIDLSLKYLSQNPNMDPEAIDRLIDRKIALEGMLSRMQPPCPCLPPPCPCAKNPAFMKPMPEAPKAARPEAMQFTIDVPGFPTPITGTVSAR